MNILIFTGRFGMGHVAVAQALREEILSQDPGASVTVVDMIEDCCPQLCHLVYGWFDFTVNRCAGVYNLLNRMAERYGCAPMKHTVTQKLDQLMRDRPADLILSTLPLCSQYISAYKQASGSSVPLYTYITDISAHSEWIAPKTDCYFVGDASTRSQLLRQGVSAGQVMVSGIPVGQAFRGTARKHGGPRELLVMGGGLGLIPNAEKTLAALTAEPDLHITVITGKNEALKKQLSAAYPAFTVLGCTDRVADYMARADLLLTKAGGSTIFEAIHAGTPLCILPPFLMQEQENAAYIARNQFGRVLDQKGDEAQALLSLLRSPSALENMRRRMAAALSRLDAFTPLERYRQEVRGVC